MSASQAPSQASRHRSSPSEETAPTPAQAASTSQTTDTFEWTASATSPSPPPASSAAHAQPDPEEAADKLEWTSINTIPSPTTASESARPGGKAEEPEIRRCWICQMDENEDGPEDTEWRSPCPCSLTAHDSCLLAWIADKETVAPGEVVADRKIKCPVCSAEINIKRPHDPIVALYGEAQRVAKSLILPAAVSGLLGCLYSGFLVYGLNTTYMVFGANEAQWLLGDRIAFARINPHTFKGLLGRMMHTMDPFFPTALSTANYKLFFALPLIGPSLIFLRTSFADQASALLLPIYFFNNPTLFPQIPWPPSPGLTFATLPLLKKTYTLLYNHAFGALERDWDRAVQRQPRDGETEEDIQRGAADDEGRAIFDLEWVGEQQRPVVEVAVEVEVEVEVDDNGIPLEQQGGIVVPAPAAAPNRWALHQNISSAYIATTVMGALAFPTISTFMGELLRLALPQKMVRYGLGYSGKGFLKEKWARTVVGGALFVVLKDAVTLYCKWKRARDFGKRRVLDYVGKRGGRS